MGRRYRTASKKAKTQILDEFVAVSEYHRKHAIHLLNGKTDNGPIQSNPCKIARSRRIYNEAVIVTFLTEATRREFIIDIGHSCGN